jgi:hypothetical protein
MDISGYDPRPEPEEEKWEHFCHSKEKELMINIGEKCSFCGETEEEEKGFYSWLGKFGI